MGDVDIPKPNWFLRVMSWAGKTLIFGVTIGTVLVLSGIGFSIYYQRKGEAEKKANLPLAKIKTWPPCEVITPWTAFVTTKWEGNEVKFKVHLGAKEGSPPLKYGQGSAFTMNFESADGFNVFTSSIPAPEMSRQVDQAEAGDTKVTGYQWQGHSYCQADDYRRATNLSMLWSGVTLVQETPKLELRPKPSVPRVVEKWQEVKNWRSIEKGMMDYHVRSLIGEPTSINEENTLTFWTYGSPRTGRYGSVAFSNKKVWSWREPE